MEHGTIDDNRLAIVAKYAGLGDFDAIDPGSDPGHSHESLRAEDGSAAGQGDADLPQVLEALDDDRCREILSVLSRPMAANELCEACDIPRSTVYRKIDLLSEAGLLREYTAIRDDGPDATLYERNFTDITVSVTADGEFGVTIERTEGDPEERIATFWTEMARES